MRVVRVSGTIKKVEEEAIRRARGAILRARREAGEDEGLVGMLGVDGGDGGGDLEVGEDEDEDEDDEVGVESDGDG